MKPKFTIDTPLREIPRTWLTMIEPKVVRSERHDCWVWIGAVDESGAAVITTKNVATGKRNTVRVARIVMKMFRPGMTSGQKVKMTCDTRNCVNPRHMTIV